MCRVLDDLNNKRRVPIDKQSPCPALTVEQVCQQFAIMVRQRHGFNSLALPNTLSRFPPDSDTHKSTLSPEQLPSNCIDQAKCLKNSAVSKKTANQLATFLIFSIVLPGSAVVCFAPLHTPHSLFHYRKLFQHSLSFCILFPTKATVQCSPRPGIQQHRSAQRSTGEYSGEFCRWMSRRRLNSWSLIFSARRIWKMLERMS